MTYSSMKTSSWMIPMLAKMILGTYLLCARYFYGHKISSLLKMNMFDNFTTSKNMLSNRHKISPIIPGILPLTMLDRTRTSTFRYLKHPFGHILLLFSHSDAKTMTKRAELLGNLLQSIRSLWLDENSWKCIAVEWCKGAIALSISRFFPKWHNSNNFSSCVTNKRFFCTVNFWTLPRPWTLIHK